MWFTENYVSKIGSITSSGVITELTIPHADCGPHDITVGPDRNIWFTCPYGFEVGFFVLATSS
jgi:virginiamycin B lyase